MATVAVHPPKTPVTKGSNTVAAATIPNICKMPGPPAPFVPTPLPNSGRSALSPKDYSKKVKIEGNPVAIGGANFASQGDVASKGTGGGLVSSNTHGVTKFIMPGSFTVKIEGKGVHLLGEPMLNNCGPTGNPPNTGATMTGLVHGPAMARAGGDNPLVIKCKDAPAKPKDDTKFDDCDKKQLCNKCADINRQAQAGKMRRRRSSYEDARAEGNAAARTYRSDARRALKTGETTVPNLRKNFTHKCAYDKWKNDNNADPDFKGFSPDHVHEIQVGGHPTSSSNLRWMSSRVNSWIGGEMSKFETTGSAKHTGVKPDCCK